MINPPSLWSSYCAWSWSWRTPGPSSWPSQQSDPRPLRRPVHLGRSAAPSKCAGRSLTTGQDKTRQGEAMSVEKSRQDGTTRSLLLKSQSLVMPGPLMTSSTVTRSSSMARMPGSSLGVTRKYCGFSLFSQQLCTMRSNTSRSFV